MQLNDQGRFWDRYIQQYPGKHAMTVINESRINGRHVRNTLKVLFKHVQLSQLQDYIVMDYGCGTGRLSKFVAPLCKKLYCVDISSAMLDEAKHYLKGHDNVEFLLIPGKDAESIPDIVDFTISYAAISYMSESDFWDTMRFIDSTSKSFCLQLHSHFNEQPDPQKSIGLLDDIYEVEGYRPRPETLLGRFSNAAQYFIEYHKPEMRNRDMFLYKSSARMGFRERWMRNRELCKRLKTIADKMHSSPA